METVAKLNSSRQQARGPCEAALTSKPSREICEPKQATFAAPAAQVGLVCVTFASVTLVAVSAGYNGTFAWLTGSSFHPAVGALAVAFAVSLDILKPTAYQLARTSKAKCTMLALGILATAVSLTSALSIQGMTRGDMVAERQAAITATERASETYRQQKQRYALAEKELAGLPETKPAGVLRAQVERLLRTPGAECSADPKSKAYGKISKRICPKVLELEGQLATSKRRVQLLEILNQPVTAPKAATKAVQVADPGAHSIASLLSALGLPVTTDLVAPFIVFLLALALEFGSSVSGVLIAELRRPRVPAEDQLRSVPSQSLRAFEPVEETLSLGHEEQKAIEFQHQLRDRLIDHLKQNGGIVRTGQRPLAKTLGVSKSEVNRLLAAMSELGQINLEPDKLKGSRIELV